MRQLTFTHPTTGEGRFIRQSGPPGRYGHVVLCVESKSNEALEFLWEAEAKDIPRQFEQSVQSGVLRLFEPGAFLEGWSSAGLKVRITGGSFHETDSNEISYAMAATAAFQKAIESANANQAV